MQDELEKFGKQHCKTKVLNLCSAIRICIKSKNRMLSTLLNINYFELLTVCEISKTHQIPRPFCRPKLILNDFQCNL